MTHKQQFFYDHAGYSWDRKTETEEQGRERYAAALETAERHAFENDWEAEWMPDPVADPLDWDGEGRQGDEAFACVLNDADGNHLSSLCGIWDPSAAYRRVVEAELALDAMKGN